MFLKKLLSRLVLVWLFLERIVPLHHTCINIGAVSTRGVYRAQSDSISMTPETTGTAMSPSVKGLWERHQPTESGSGFNGTRRSESGVALHRLQVAVHKRDRWVDNADAALRPPSWLRVIER